MSDKETPAKLPTLYQREFRIMLYGTDREALERLVDDLWDTLAGCPRNTTYGDCLEEVSCVQVVEEGTERAVLIAANVSDEHLEALGYAPRQAEE